MCTVTDLFFFNQQVFKRWRFIIIHITVRYFSCVRIIFCWLCGSETSKLVVNNWIVMRKKYSLIFVSESCSYVILILDKTLTLRLALLILSFRSSEKLCSESVFIPGNFSRSLFFISVFVTPTVYLTLPFARKWHLSLLAFF